ncbi:SpoIIE family protein phosphatase [Streptomyces sp. NPDC048290]|uniref:ATP-binding SpoIIE family protein phosphatase n=1 Tax=Streptomyces sp. NPDC048290 TaxID=3155811 RepID=UPI00343F8ABF
MEADATRGDERRGALLDARRDDCLATALRSVHARLAPATSTVYLATGQGDRANGDGPNGGGQNGSGQNGSDRNGDGESAITPMLLPAMAVDTPLGFTLTPAMPADDKRYSSAVAYRTGHTVIWDDERIRGLVRGEPAMIQFVPYAMVVASVPVRTQRRRFGALTLRWAPPREVTDETVEFLTAAADRLAMELEALAGQGARLEPPPAPVFIPAAPDAPWGPASSTGFLYRFQRLATGLTAAKGVRDVLATTLSEVVRPFGGRAMALCLTERGRLRIAGSAGFARTELRGLDGLVLTGRSPEADATVGLRLLFEPSATALHRAYPGLDRYDDDSCAWLFLPLIADGHAVGCCVLAAERPSTLGDADLSVLMIMLGQVGQSLQRARAYEREHLIARSMQHGLLPRTLPHLAEIVSTARYLPADTGAEVGGDWYDMIRLPGDRVGLVIGDVEGHSLEAGGTMGQLRSAVRAYATEGHDPAEVLARSNRLLCALDTNHFATCCCLWLDLETGTATLASAGHPAPVLTDADGLGLTCEVRVGPPLGVDPESTYLQTECALTPGSVVALFTDGLLDLSHRDVDSGLAELRSTLVGGRDEDLEILADRLVGETGSATLRDDDLALLLVRYDGHGESPYGRVAQVFVQRRDLRHVGRLRHYMQDLLPGWGLDGLQDELELLLTEVVTNALVHADSDVDVRLREYPDHLRVEVRDSDPRPPLLVADLGPGDTGDAQAESGRGMLIVDALAQSWGSSPAGRGKTTWFELGVPQRG